LEIIGNILIFIQPPMKYELQVSLSTIHWCSS